MLLFSPCFTFLLFVLILYFHHSIHLSLFLFTTDHTGEQNESRFMAMKPGLVVQKQNDTVYRADQQREHFIPETRPCPSSIGTRGPRPPTSSALPTLEPTSPLATTTPFLIAPR
jgi:hypothetical protein